MLPVNPNAINGNDRAAFWSLGGRSNPSTVTIPIGQTFLWLDPSVTTPNVLLGVRGAGGTFYMRPGDVVRIGARQGSLRVWNALLDVMTPPGVTSLVGYLGLKSGTDGELPAIVASRGAGIHPRATMLCASVVTVGYDIWVPLCNLTGVRVSVQPLLGNAVANYSAPADFAATIRPSLVWPIPNASLQVPPSTPPYDPIAVVGLEDPGTFFGQWFIASEQDLTASQLQMAWDRPVVVPSFALSLSPVVVTGTGVSATRLAVFVEGR